MTTDSVIVTAILDQDNGENLTTIILQGATLPEIMAKLKEDDTAVSDYISEETGWCVQEIVSMVQADYII